MTWALFIDDERNPSDVTWAPAEVERFYSDAVVCRNVDQVFATILQKGYMPSFISFDHDLGDKTASGYDIAKDLIDLDLEQYYSFPRDFCYFVHSKNPVGARAIYSLLANYFGEEDVSML